MTSQIGDNISGIVRNFLTVASVFSTLDLNQGKLMNADNFFKELESGLYDK